MRPTWPRLFGIGIAIGIGIESLRASTENDRGQPDTIDADSDLPAIAGTGAGRAARASRRY